MSNFFHSPVFGKQSFTMQAGEETAEWEAVRAGNRTAVLLLALLTVLLGIPGAAMHVPAKKMEPAPATLAAPVHVPQLPNAILLLPSLLQRESPRRQEHIVRQQLERGWYVQLAAVESLESAAGPASPAADADAPLVLWEVSISGKRFYRILSGPFGKRTEAIEMKEKLKELAVQKDAFIRRID